MLGLIFIGLIIFGFYKVVKWAKENTDLDLSTKNIFILAFASLIALLHWSNKPSEKENPMMRNYTCKKCGMQTSTSFNPSSVVKSACNADGRHHFWQNN